jgi:hypothetical protein
MPLPALRSHLSVYAYILLLKLVNCEDFDSQLSSCNGIEELEIVSQPVAVYSALLVDHSELSGKIELVRLSTTMLP